ncbi:hypothetical protein BASH2_05363 [Bacillus anthracis]|nr:hypothetical protein BASH2_05363 [Bacillus anthracis]
MCRNEGLGEIQQYVNGRVIQKVSRVIQIKTLFNRKGE